LFTECLYTDTPRLDGDNRFRVDELELDPKIQAKVEAIWPQVSEENLKQFTDFDAYSQEFLRLFGFDIAGVDYDAETSPLVTADF
jgi:enoyl-[acyl-carrier protein] reductase/trans-2-enoyl-CoA reductase (NAD+)